jgi:hypothetical protein
MQNKFPLLFNNMTIDIRMEECFICFEETDQFIFFECAHKVCTRCFPQLRSHVCPICGCSIPEPIISVPEQLVVYPSTRWKTVIVLCAVIVIILWCKRNVIF